MFDYQDNTPKSQPVSNRTIQLSEEVAKALSEMPTDEATLVLNNVKRILYEQLMGRMDEAIKAVEDFKQRIAILKSSN